MFEPREIWHPLTGLTGCKPEKFTFPFNYIPHPWVIQAADELKEYLDHQTDFTYAFGHDDFSVGKMFGVLVCENQVGETGYLAAFSGKINEKNQLPGFVPPVFDVLNPDGTFKSGEQELNQINLKIEAAENATDFIELKHQIQENLKTFENDLNALKMLHRNKRKKRKELRNTAGQRNSEEIESLFRQLENESKSDHFEMKDLRKSWQNQLERMQQDLKIFEDEIENLKEKRKAKSAALQQVLHESFVFLNSAGKSEELLPIFEPYGKMPPAGAGECAGPRLLQYAFQQNLKPLAMGEFWYGKPPTGQIREHGSFYPACKSKCEPILTFMLQGMKLDSNPAEQINSDYELDILYEDAFIIAVNKPTGVLSVPGKKIKSCLQSRIQEYCRSDEVLLVHRLDMSTSGTILAAKNQEIYRLLQEQFTQRTVKKTYTALLEGILDNQNGKIDLPMRVDLDHRPMQLVDPVYGKNAVTFYQRIGTENGRTRMLFYPYTGRTHQLRVHAAHTEGLNLPIAGDELYGTAADRLYLHATTLEFDHPVSGKRLKLTAEVPF